MMRAFFSRRSDAEADTVAAVLAAAVSPRTDELGDAAALVNAEYDGTLPGLRAAVETLETNAFLAALSNSSIYQVLRSLTNGEVFLDLSLDAVDAIIVERVGKRIVRIDRRDGTAASTGRTAVIDLRNVEKYKWQIECATAAADPYGPLLIGLVAGLAVTFCAAFAMGRRLR